MSRIFIVRLCLFLAASIAATAGSISTTGEVTGTQHNVIGITGFATLGSEMGGLLVTVSFAGQPNRSCTWAATTATAGGCTVAEWFSITEDGDTFTSNWVFTNLSNVGATLLVLDGSPSRTTSSGVVFDRLFGGAAGTPGSALGTDATGNTSDASVGSATYSDVVAVQPNAPVGDLFATLSIAFSASLGGGQTATFNADTDTVGLSGEVPEPGTAGLLGAGIAGLFLARRRRVRG